MLKNTIQLESIIDGKTYRLTCDNDSPIPNVKEALFQFLKIAGKIEDAAKEAQKKSEEETKIEVLENSQTA